MSDNTTQHRFDPTRRRTLSAASIRRFKRCDMRYLAPHGRQPRAAIREQINALRFDEGLIVIVSSLPGTLIGELDSRGFASRLEPGQNGDWFLWLWRDVK